MCTYNGRFNPIQSNPTTSRAVLELTERADAHRSTSLGFETILPGSILTNAADDLGGLKPRQRSLDELIAFAFDEDAKRSSAQLSSAQLSRSSRQHCCRYARLTSKLEMHSAADYTAEANDSGCAGIGQIGSKPTGVKCAAFNASPTLRCQSTQSRALPASTLVPKSAVS